MERALKKAVLLRFYPGLIVILCVVLKPEDDMPPRLKLKINSFATSHGSNKRFRNRFKSAWNMNDSNDSSRVIHRIPDFSEQDTWIAPEALPQFLGSTWKPRAGPWIERQLL